MEMEQRILQCISFNIYDGSRPGQGSAHCMLLRTCRLIEVHLEESIFQSEVEMALLIPAVTQASWDILLGLYYLPQFYAKYSVNSAGTFCKLDEHGANEMSPFALSSKSIALGCLISALRHLVCDEQTQQQIIGGRKRNVEQDGEVTAHRPPITLSGIPERAASPEAECRVERTDSSGLTGKRAQAMQLLQWVMDRIDIIVADTRSIHKLSNRSGQLLPSHLLILSQLQLLLMWLASISKI
jgi:hypothetical protein